MNERKTHWRKFDFRKDSLTHIIIGLNNSINSLKDFQSENKWYDGLFFREDTEQIYGLAFIAFQNYINGSISDLYNDLSNKNHYYNLNGNFEIYSKSSIELIIGLANYIKHKEEKKLYQGTTDILDSFGLLVNQKIEQSPVFEGLTLLNDSWDLMEVLKMVLEWREKLFLEFEKHSQ